MRNKCILLLIAVVTAGCSQSQSEKVTVDHNNQPISPDEVVTLAAASFGCKMKSDLIKAAKQYQKHEFAAFARTTRSESGCFYEPPHGLKWTVYEIDYPAVSVGFASFKQYQAVKKTYSGIDPRGVYWVPSGFVYAAE